MREWEGGAPPAPRYRLSLRAPTWDNVNTVDRDTTLQGCRGDCPNTGADASIIQSETRLLNNTGACFSAIQGETRLLNSTEGIPNKRGYSSSTIHNHIRGYPNTGGLRTNPNNTRVNLQANLWLGHRTGPPVIFAFPVGLQLSIGILRLSDTQLKKYSDSVYSDSTQL